MGGGGGGPRLKQASVAACGITGEQVLVLEDYFSQLYVQTTLCLFEDYVAVHGVPEVLNRTRTSLRQKVILS